MDLSTCPTGRRRQQHFPRHPHDHHHEVSNTKYHSSCNTTHSKKKSVGVLEKNPIECLFEDTLV
ncbi:hypothetical protein M5D96_005769 [Drosophila gunungcola]|uniref:Uncharacterized protein n=1 Tax=Drosophila gunungcola TaxID=103775 RepID=A0A9P9YRU0_9MUSC|nr:hypothetical protein M5D96_005769 [Drosophila gunungcola]